MILEVIVPGAPRPQGSKNAYRRGSRIVLVESAKGLKEWRAQVSLHAQIEAQRSGWSLAGKDQPVRVEILFLISKPKSARRTDPVTKPDLDKLIRAALDGVTQAKSVWIDDSQVVEINAEKRYAPGEPGTIVRIIKWDQSVKAIS